MGEGKFNKVIRTRKYGANITELVQRFKGNLDGYKYPFDDATWETLKEIIILLDEARKDFIKDFTDDDWFVLKEYGLEDDVKMHPGAIELKHQILEKWGRQSVKAFLRWFGDDKK